LTQQTLKAAFIKAFNSLLENRDEILEGFDTTSNNRFQHYRSTIQISETVAI